MEAAAKAVISETFDALDSDITLISSDGIHFRVHSLQLRAASKVFKDMLELGTNLKEAKAEVQMVESADVLEVVLPYVYPNYVPPFKIQLPLTLGVITCFHKLEIWRGLEAIQAAFQIVINHGSPGLRDRELSKKCFIAYTLATLLKDREFALKAYLALCDLDFTWKDLAAFIYDDHNCDSHAAMDLVQTWSYNLCLASDQFRQMQLIDPHESHPDHLRCHLEITQVWSKFSTIKSLSELDRFASVPSSACPDCQTMLSNAIADLRWTVGYWKTPRRFDMD